ncbi:MAG: glutathione S-transferase family protein [Rhodospirillaceae bacterium]|nr:glutathione S-transferase family protein [Rhodospirillaceae bacterium]MCY4067131.1 glutathione S-transferase family protein [Rhodospirillaceae bacterium]MDE0704223.1 glutathione S-transferase family protein [Rhodospirillaceae bacterium]
MPKNDLRVWGIGTSRTMRAHWMLAEMDVDYELRPIGPRTGETLTEEYLRLNPRHKVPVIEHGPFVLAESAAIINYLSETFPAPEGFFVPGDPVRRAALNEWCFFVMTELDAHPLYVIRRHLQLAHIYGEAPRAIQSAREYFCEQIDGMMKKFPDGMASLMPEGMSIADILMVTCLDYALTLEIPLPQALLAYREGIVERPAYRRACEINFV